ncbi:HEAT repeat domain-containing protein [Cohnella pontilimi]|uniref:HEAT repeat domain-containing protein n=1 Tax=Cohnella pontilimi TaxID=2564100 RepID=A0A4V5LS67_9BACL|nr:HEAT repeat domain-containing protein [Cohnella pontilimi]TJY41469.1 HEAT repeat domain-containing protein [Cohnella pontilimi]
MTDRANDNLVLFPKTLDFYQIQLTRMLETERYGDAKALLSFLLQCGGDAERHHTEWQALLGWLEAAFPEAVVAGNVVSVFDEEDGEEEETETDWVRQRVTDRSLQDSEYVPRLLQTLRQAEGPDQQMLVIGQLLHLTYPDIEPALREWLALEEYHPSVQFRALQALRKQGASGAITIWRDGEPLTLEIGDTPLSFGEFPPAVLSSLERVRQAAEISDPTLSYFAEEMWKECVQAAYGMPIFRTMTEDDDGSSDVWAAALHQILLEKLHGKTNDDETREQYGITDELRFRYEQALRWLRQYAVEPRGSL